MKKITIAIDGGAGVGKGVTARGVAQALGYIYVDTGAMYRALTLYIIENAIEIDEEKIVSILDQVHIDFVHNPQTMLDEVRLNQKNVEHRIRQADVDALVSKVAGFPKIRHRLVEQQKGLLTQKGVVMEGRDIGTVVAPDAELKIHLIADLDIRAQRRQKQLREKGINRSLEEIKQNLRERDDNDLYGERSSSTISPDALEVDTSFLTIEEQVKMIVEMAKSRIERGK